MLRPGWDSNPDFANYSTIKVSIVVLVIKYEKCQKLNQSKLKSFSIH